MLWRLGIEHSIRIMSLRQTRSASKSSAPSMSMPPPQAANMARKRKAPAKIADIDGPSTPKRKTKTLPSSVLTPTPAAINVMAHTTRASSPATPKSKKARRADPKATNAPLQTPGGSKVLKTYPSDLLESSSPSKGGIITTDNLLEKACAHLCAVDPKLKPLVERHTCKMFTPEGLAENVEPFEALVSSIISQQVRADARVIQSLSNNPRRSQVLQPQVSSGSSSLYFLTHSTRLGKTISRLLVRWQTSRSSFSARQAFRSVKQNTFRDLQRSLRMVNCLHVC